MKLFMKSISTLLAVLMMLGSFTVLSVFSVSAADKNETTEPVEKTAETIKYTQEVFKNPEEALAWMVPYLENDNFIMYFNEYTGAFGVKNKKTGQVQFSNPYDVASSKGSEKTKRDILSQIIVKYSDNTTNNTSELNSYYDAALNGQIQVKRIKGGVRVEYIIGNESTRKLVPRLLSEKSYKTNLVAPLEEAIGGEHNFDRFVSFYERQDPSEAKSQKTLQSMIARYPNLGKKDSDGNFINVYYNLDTTASAVDINFLEELIKGYTEYTFDMMDADHDETGYEAQNELSPVFKMALEYTLNEDGFTVRQPTNGLRYNTTLYTIENLDIRPYMGAGNGYNTGYTFYPDGSGALFRFEELNGKSTFTASRMIYGNDFAYHNITGKYQKALRMPVFGIQSNDSFYTYTTTQLVVDEDTGEEVSKETVNQVSLTVLRTMKDTDIDADLEMTNEEKDIAKLTKMLEEQLKNKDFDSYGDIKLVTQGNGYFAVIEEGESLCQLATFHAGSLSDYHTIKTSFNPRPKDSYDLGDSISVSGSQTQTVVSDRKYTGNLKIRYVMLSDETLATDTGFTDTGSYYEASYIGMAKAYSNYLAAQEILTRLTEEDVEKDIPLYIEAFGMIEVTEQIMSFPVTVDKPLTTFEDIATMYDELSAEGVNNINFRLTGFANGGMYAVVPTKIKWEKAVGGKDGMIALLEKAEKINEGDGNLTLYPEFELMYVLNTAAFDGMRYKRDVIRTIDNRYASQKEYSATYQTWISYYNLALSPAYMDRFYNKLLAAYDEYLDYGALGISSSSMGTDLNTDFDEDEPYNREDNKAFIKEALKALSSKEGMAGLMTDGGNAYTYQYADHLLNISLDSSRFMKASNSIPFVGMVLHGYIQFAGSPINMEGDTNYAMLKAIENGASLYFIMSYRNTNYLKEFSDLSKYYSVNYSIWKEDVIKYYNELNAVMSDVQTSLIIDHQFISGTRVLDVSEIEAAVRDQMIANDEYEKVFDEMTWLDHIAEIAAARAAAKSAVKAMEDALEELSEDVIELNKIVQTLSNRIRDCDTKKKVYENSLLNPTASESTRKLNLRNYNTAKGVVARTAANGVQIAVDAQALYEKVAAQLEAAQKAIVLLTEAGAAQELIDDARTCAENAETYLASIKKIVDECNTKSAKIYSDVSGHLTEADIEDRLILPEEEEDVEDTEDDVDSIYLSDNGNIVTVTYGGKDGDDTAAYKTFILNYNKYAVTVKFEVNGEMRIYTIPANEYVVVLH